MRLDSIALDTDLLKSGVWWDFSTRMPCPGNKPHGDHGCLLIVPAIDSGFRQELETLMLPYAEMLRKKPDADEAQHHADALEAVRWTVTAKALARKVLVGMANWERSDGTPIEYTADEGAKILSDKRFLALRQFVENASAETEAARSREEEQAAGN